MAPPGPLPYAARAMRLGLTLTVATLALLGSLSGGCAPQIGDACESSVDCSVNGDRICDIAQPGGYCTVANCEEGTCPDDSLCVEFRFARERLASSWCMAPCEDDGECRPGYLCVEAEEILANDDSPNARLLDTASPGRFCVAEAE